MDKVKELCPCLEAAMQQEASDKVKTVDLGLLDDASFWLSFADHFALREGNEVSVDEDSSSVCKHEVTVYTAYNVSTFDSFHVYRKVHKTPSRPVSYMFTFHGVRCGRYTSQVRFHATSSAGLLPSNVEFLKKVFLTLLETNMWMQ